jgi:hypothetical protein
VAKDSCIFVNHGRLTAAAAAAATTAAAFHKISVGGWAVSAGC